MVGSSLDQFFGDERNWKKVGKAIANGPKSASPGPAARNTTGQVSFRIQVPKPYPGVQYRNSKCLDDRHPRYAQNGCVVSGRVEDNGEWLKVGEHVYLPMRVGSVRIMEPVPQADDPQAAASPNKQTAESGFWKWWACCSGEKSSASMDSEVIVNPDEGARFGGRPQPPPAGGRGAPSADVPMAAGPFGSSAASSAGVGLSQAQQQLQAEQHRQHLEEAEGPRSKPLPEDVSRNPLSNLDAANRHFSKPINPFSDSMAPGVAASPTKRRNEVKSSDSPAQGARHQDPIKDVFQA